MVSNCYMLEEAEGDMPIITDLHCVQGVDNDVWTIRYPFYNYRY